MSAAESPVFKALAVSEIEQRDDVQIRSKLNDSAIETYAAVLKSGGTLDPPVVYRIDGRPVLAAGAHRLRACQLAGLKTIVCEVRAGTLADAILEAATSNLKNGVQLSSKEKRRVIRVLLLNDPTRKSRDIARQVGVDHKTVGSERYRLTVGGEIPQRAERADVAVTDIRLGTQLRDQAPELDAAVTRMAAALSDEATFVPAIHVFKDASGQLWIGDGRIRLDAHKLNGTQTVRAHVLRGGEREAFLFGVERIVAEEAWREKAVCRLLGDPERSQWSDLKISDLANVDVERVAELRAERAPFDPQQVIRNSAGVMLNERTVMAALAADVDETGFTSMSVASLAAQPRLNHESAIQGLAQLTDLGVVSVVEPTDDRPSGYQFHNIELPPLETRKFSIEGLAAAANPERAS